MKLGNIIKNIVFAGQFDPLSFDKYFFIKNNIVKDEDILPNSIFNGLTAVVVNTKDFQIQVHHHQILIYDSIPKNNSDLIANIGAILVENSVSPIIACGINFQYFMFDEEYPMNELTRKLFYNDKNSISKFFADDNCHFGMYMSKNIGNARLKLDIKPATLNQTKVSTNTTSTRETVFFQFNYHFDAKTDDSKSQVLEYLKDYNFFLQNSAEIISIYE